jgi:hypothetical protein
MMCPGLVFLLRLIDENGELGSWGTNVCPVIVLKDEERHNQVKTVYLDLLTSGKP